MKIIGAEEALATGTTKGKTVTAHYVFNTGSVRVGANAGVVIHTDIGVGMRGASDIKITPIVASGF